MGIGGPGIDQLAGTVLQHVQTAAIATDGDVEHARGGRVEHSDPAVLVDGHGGRLHVQQDCALELVYEDRPPLIQADPSRSNMSPAPRT
jgi:hypothetical protein